LHPESPLARGFARITTADGKSTIVSSRQAMAAGVVRLNFSDGGVEALVQGGKAPAQKAKPSFGSGPSTTQQDLFGEG
ncbi:MAG TPA: exodeoxyribonuclease VII large subunit, partial [Sphingorhabdus sp.]|nr:exodeoxyribonuclease VII large subunit [Sphingorhabdus sp.]